MFNTAREKFLAVLFGGSIAALGLWETIGRMALQPLTDALDAVGAARSANESLQSQSTTVDHALRNLKQLAGRSLPSDPGKASVLYQGWLIGRLEQNAIASAIVTPAPAMVEKSLGHRIPFTVQCEASTHQLARFLDQFYATPLLHRITNLNISNSSEGAADHRVTISLEALAFDTATNIDTLPEPGVVQHESSLMAAMSAGDIFRRQLPVQTYVETTTAAVEREPEPSQDANPPDPINPLQCVRFVASVWNGQQREAWLVDGRSSEEITVVAASDLNLPDISGRILAVGDDVLHLEIGGQPCSIRLGQTLEPESDPTAP